MSLRINWNMRKRGFGESKLKLSSNRFMFKLKLLENVEHKFLPPPGHILQIAVGILRWIRDSYWVHGYFVTYCSLLCFINFQKDSSNACCIHISKLQIAIHCITSMSFCSDTHFSLLNIDLNNFNLSILRSSNACRLRNMYNKNSCVRMLRRQNPWCLASAMKLSRRVELVNYHPKGARRMSACGAWMRKK